MLIALMRHGEAESTAKTGRDFDRALSQNGIKNAEFIGKILVKRAILPKKVVCSPALRTRQTLDALHLDGCEKTDFYNQLYQGNITSYLSMVENAAQNDFPLLVVGHNPAISLLMSKLCCSKDISAPFDFLKPASLALIDVPENNKQQFIGRGHLIDVVTP